MLLSSTRLDARFRPKCTSNVYQMLDDTKGVVRIRISQDRKYNSKTKMDTIKQHEPQ
jgi:hypothetical protein